MRERSSSVRCARWMVRAGLPTPVSTPSPRKEPKPAATRDTFRPSRSYRRSSMRSRLLPVIAAGGIADGRRIAAVLMLGAEGVWIGTRFLATRECGVSDADKAAVINATTDDTILTDVYDIARSTPWPTGVSGRAIRDEFADRWHGRDEESGDRARESPGPRPRQVGRQARGHWAGEHRTSSTSVSMPPTSSSCSRALPARS